MSGSESSAPASAPQPAPEALSFSVHALPAPGQALARRRIVGGRLRLLLVLLACAAPVIASYLTYYVIRPDARANYASLILPTRALPADLALRDLAGQPVDAATLKGQWLLLVVGDAACGEACERRLFLQRQLREMMGRDSARIDRVWLLTDGALPHASLLAAAEATGGMTVLHADADALGRWLAPAPGQALADHLYLVDPMGEWMMRAPADPDPAKLKRDLSRLLRASASWDREGR